MARVFMLLSVIFISVYVTEQAYFLEEDYINKINEQATTWKAGPNFDPNISEEQIVKLLGSKGKLIPNNENDEIYKSEDEAYNSIEEIPSHFDARERWKNCNTIGRVRDQGHCGSCWAMSTSSAFADRLCVATNGSFNQLLSAEELTFCCHKCGYACHGGYPIKAWERFKTHGLVTGGDYNSGEGCEPYRVPPCIYDEEGRNPCNNLFMEHNHRCRRKCYGDEDLDFNTDHRYTRDYYYLTSDIIQKDVMTYGPIEATFDVYDDFYSYQSGIYQKTEGARLLAGHAVKLIGWGEENGILYWLMVNSWNEQWGENGLFRIRRGTNECRIEDSTTAGVPLIN